MREKRLHLGELFIVLFQHQTLISSVSMSRPESRPCRGKERDQPPSSIYIERCKAASLLPDGEALIPGAARARRADQRSNCMRARLD
jgi:hypothetical protein